MASLMLKLFGLIFRLSWKYLVQLQFLLITREQLHFKSPVTRTLLLKLLSLILFIWDFVETIIMFLLFWEQWPFYLQSLTHETLFPPLSFPLIHPSLILSRMLYILLFRQIFLSRLILLIPLVILVFYVRINLLSRKRIFSSNSSYKVKALFSSKREKRKITEAKKITMLTKQIK